MKRSAQEAFNKLSPTGKSIVAQVLDAYFHPRAGQPKLKAANEMWQTIINEGNYRIKLGESLALMDIIRDGMDGKVDYS